MTSSERQTTSKSRPSVGSLESHLVMHETL